MALGHSRTSHFAEQSTWIEVEQEKVGPDCYEGEYILYFFLLCSACCICNGELGLATQFKGFRHI